MILSHLLWFRKRLLLISIGLILPLSACIETLPTNLTVGDQSSIPTQKISTDAGVDQVSTASFIGPWPTSAHCRPIQINASLDVDSAYSRAMRNFSFITEQELQSLERDRYSLRDPIYKHAVTRGSFYRLEQLVNYIGPQSNQKKLHLSLTLAKEGKGTSITGGYCTNPANPQEAVESYHIYIMKKIRSTFQ